MLHVIKAEATYLLWVDCNALKGDLSDFSDFIRKTSGLYVSDGQEYRPGLRFLKNQLGLPEIPGGGRYEPAEKKYSCLE